MMFALQEHCKEQQISNRYIVTAALLLPTARLQGDRYCFALGDSYQNVFRLLYQP